MLEPKDVAININYTADTTKNYVVFDLSIELDDHVDGYVQVSKQDLLTLRERIAHVFAHYFNSKEAYRL